MELATRSLQEYTQQLISLMPTGWLWEKVLGANKKLKALMEVFANELLFVDTRISDLINELTLNNPTELVPRWESILALPDSCTGVLPTLQQRVAAILGRLQLLGYQRGNLSEQFYIDLAARFDYTITITVLSENNWQVNAPILTATYFKAGVSRAGDPIQTSGNALLQCIINRTKPAHTAVTYNFF